MPAQAGNFFGAFLQSFTQAKAQKAEKEQREKEIKAKTTLYDIELRRAQQQEREANARMLAEEQQRQARERFFSDASSMASPQNERPMTLTDLLADPQMGLRALQAGIVGPEQLIKKPVEDPTSIQELRALLQDPALMEAEMRRRAASASSTNVNVDTGERFGKLEPGMFRPDPSQPGVMPEPGSQAELERIQAEKKRQAGAATATANQSSVIQNVDEAIAMVNPFTAGLGSFAAVVPGSPQFALASTIKSIKANLGVDKIQEMRANSPTGGALGSTSNLELDQLQSSVAALDQGLDDKVLKKNLEKVKKHYENWQKTVQKAAQLPAGIPAGSVQIGTSGGKPVYRSPDGKQYIVE